MTKALLATEAGCAIFEEASVGDDTPFNDPVGNLSRVFFHSDFDYYGLIVSGATTINHASVPGVTTTLYSDPSFTFVTLGQSIAADHLLYQHNLGYVPKFFAAYNGMMIPHGMPVQAEDSARVRYACAYATASQIRLRETAFSSQDALSAASLAYQFLVFRDPSAGLSGDQLLIEAGNVWFGRGKFRSSEGHLRVSGAGDTIFAIARGPTADWNNGGMRVVDPNHAFHDIGGYGGSFAGPDTVSVTV